MKKLVYATTLALLSTLVAAAPATAGTASDAYVSVTASDVTLPIDGCGESPYSLNASFPTAAHWTVTLTIDAPDGSTAGSDVVFGPETATSGETFLCQYTDQPGTYDAVAEYTAYDEDYATIAAGTVRTTFRVTARTKMATALKTTRTKLGKRNWKITGQLRRAGQPFRNQNVAIQARIAGDWYDIRTRRTDAQGRARWVTDNPVKNNYSFRLRFAGTADTNGSTSRVFKLPKR